MSHAHDHGNSQDVTIPSGPGKPPLHFSDAEWQSFRQSDMGAAKAVVVLMGSIFGTGLVLYSIVAYVVWFKVM
jgi:hypothetical protein